MSPPLLLLGFYIEVFKLRLGASLLLGASALPEILSNHLLSSIVTSEEIILAKVPKCTQMTEILFILQNYIELVDKDSPRNPVEETDCLMLMKMLSPAPLKRRKSTRTTFTKKFPM